MPILVSNPLDRTVTLISNDGDSVSVPAKTRSVKVHVKFREAVPNFMSVTENGVARHEREEGHGEAETEPAPKAPSPPLNSGIGDSYDDDNASSSQAPPL